MPTGTNPGFVVAVDGPAASGKGTIARRLAADERLFNPRALYLDTGLLYRAVGLIASKPPWTLARAAEVAAQMTPETMDLPGYRTREAGELASQVAVDPGVRAALFDFQRRMAANPKGAVLDGRDIGTVIVPDAPAKLYVTATPEVRAERRWRQLRAQGEDVALEAILSDILIRDARDGGRDAAPMEPAPDAYLLDTTEMTIERAFDTARRYVEEARARWVLSRG